MSKQRPHSKHNTNTVNTQHQSKKRNIKKDNIKTIQEIDMISFKQKISQEIALTPSITRLSCIQNPLPSSSPIDIYNEHYKRYISEEFNTTCIVFINRLISESQSLPLHIKNMYNVHKLILKIVKELMMNEYEIAIFSLLLDDVGWSRDNYLFEDNLFYIGLYVKKYTLDKEFDFLMKYYGVVKNEFEKKYMKWKSESESMLNGNNNGSGGCNSNSKESGVNLSRINFRFRLLKQPYNIYCKTNYVDYNCVVDKILKMSLPYTDTKLKEDEYYDNDEEYNGKYGDKEEEKEDENESKCKQEEHNNKQNVINTCNNTNTIIKLNTDKQNNNNIFQVNNNVYSLQQFNNNTINDNRNDQQHSKNDFLQRKHNLPTQTNFILQTQPQQQPHQYIQKPQQKTQYHQEHQLNPIQPIIPNQLFQTTQTSPQATYFSGLGIYRTAQPQQIKYYNYSQQPSQQNLITPSIQPSAAYDSGLNNIHRSSVQTLDSGLPQEDELTQIFYQSNPNFFRSAISLKDSAYNSELDPFNIKGSSMLVKHFEQMPNNNKSINNGNTTIDDNVSSNQIIINTGVHNNSNYPYAFSQINVQNGNNVQNIPQYNNIIINEQKTNLLGVYNTLKKQQEQNM